jgi:Tfp pilus assembly protein PilE
MAKLSDIVVSLLIIGTATTTQSFKNLAEKAREVEAKIIVGAINMLQQPFLIENQRFASTLEELNLGIPPETENYEYKFFALDQTQAQVTAKAKQRGLRSYTGAVFLVKNNTLENSITVIVCETDQASQTPPGMPQAPQSSEHEIKCPSGSKQLGR